MTFRTECLKKLTKEFCFITLIFTAAYIPEPIIYPWSLYFYHTLNRSDDFYHEIIMGEQSINILWHRAMLTCSYLRDKVK